MLQPAYPKSTTTTATSSSGAAPGSSPPPSWLPVRLVVSLLLLTLRPLRQRLPPPPASSEVRFGSTSARPATTRSSNGRSACTAAGRSGRPLAAPRACASTSRSVTALWSPCMPVPGLSAGELLPLPFLQAGGFARRFQEEVGWWFLGSLVPARYSRYPTSWLSRRSWRQSLRSRQASTRPLSTPPCASPSLGLRGRPLH
jgi:hypothetical protein